MAAGGGCSLGEAEWVAALNASGLLDASEGDAVDRLTSLARRLLGTAAAMTTFVAGERQYLKTALGLPESWVRLRERPHVNALCREVVARKAALAVVDAGRHPLVGADAAAREMHALAYLGVPLAGPHGEVLGTFCVIDRVPRVWTADEIETLTGLSRAVQGEIAARLHRRQRERLERERHEAEADITAILEGIDAAFYRLDRDWRLLYVNRHAEGLWGRRRQDLLGHTLFEVFPAFAGSAAHSAHEQALAEGRPVRIETAASPYGRAVEIDVLPSAAGLSVFFRDISARKDLEEALRERDETLTLAERSAEIGIWDVDLATGTVRGRPQFFRLMGLEPVAGRIPIETLRALRHPEDREQVLQGFRQTVESGADYYEMEYRIVRPDRKLRWIFGRGRVVRDGSGRPIRYSGVDLDVTERKRMEEQQRLLLAELNHRVRNSIAMIQGIAVQSLTDGRPLEEAREAFLSRLQALSEAHGHLTQEEWRGIGLCQLADDELRPYGERVRVEGEDIVLKPKAALLMRLVLHELATNAVKHGALGSPHGWIKLAWSIADGASFHLTWEETGGPAACPGARRGFGRVLLERAVVHELQGQSSMRFAPEGLRYEILAPVREIVD